jgi:hypothetical protein
MGQEIPNPLEDTAKKLVCLLNFLMPPYQLGNLPGDAERYDPKGNMLIVKEEPVSDSDEEQTVNNTKSESDEIEIIAVKPQGTTKLNPGNLRQLERMAKARREQEEKGNRAPKPEKIKDDEPTPSTLTGITNYVTMDPANLRNIPGHIEIDGLTMAEYFTEHMRTDLTIQTNLEKSQPHGSQTDKLHRGQKSWTTIRSWKFQTQHPKTMTTTRLWTTSSKSWMTTSPYRPTQHKTQHRTPLKRKRTLDLKNS